MDCIAHLLNSTRYKRMKKDRIKLPNRSNKERYDDQAGLRAMKFVEERY